MSCAQSIECLFNRDATITCSHFEAADEIFDSIQLYGDHDDLRKVNFSQLDSNVGDSSDYLLENLVINDSIRHICLIYRHQTTKRTTEEKDLDLTRISIQQLQVYTSQSVVTLPSGSLFTPYSYRKCFSLSGTEIDFSVTQILQGEKTVFNQQSRLLDSSTSTSECDTTNFDEPALTDQTFQVGDNSLTYEFAEFSDYVGRSNQSPQQCGNRKYSISISPEASFISLVDQRKISVYTEDNSKSGTYIVTVSAYLEERPSIKISANFQVTVQACLLQRIDLPSLPGNLLFELIKISRTNLPITVRLANVQQTPNCFYSIKLEAISNPTLQILTKTFDQDGNLVIDVEDSSDRTQKGDYSLTITATPNDYKYDPVPEAVYQSESFRVSDPCPGTTLEAQQIDDQTYYVTSSGAVTLQTMFSDTINDRYSQSSGEKACGDYKYEIRNQRYDSAGPDLLESSELSISDTGEISININDQSRIGSVYTITIIANLEDYPDIDEEISFQLTIQACQVSTITLPSSFSAITDLTYEVITHEASTTLPITLALSDIIQYPQCGYDMAITITDSDLSLQSSSLNSDGDLSIEIQQSDDRTLAANYNSITVIVELTDYSYTPVPKVEQTISVSVLDPCLSTVVIPPSPALSDMTFHVISDIAVSQQAGVFDDTTSQLLPQTNGFLCGSRSYSISSDPSTLTATELSIDPSTGVFQVDITDKSKIGDYSVTVTATIDNISPPISGEQSFKLTVSPCVVASITYSSSITSLSYEVLTHKTSKSMPISFKASDILQTPSCGYATSITYSMTPALSILQSSSQGGDQIFNFLDSSDRTLARAYTLVIKPELTGYSLTPVPTADETIKLAVLDPCRNTVISDIELEDLAAFSQYDVFSSTEYLFTDYVDYQLSSDDDYCGKKEFSLNLPQGSFNQVSFNNGETMKFVPSSDQNAYGTEDAFLQVTMKDLIPTISLTKYFKVTKLAYLPLLLPDQKYVIGTSGMSIQIPDFTVLPTEFSMKDYTTSYAAYWNKSNQTLEYPLNVSLLAPIPDFIVFNANDGNITNFTVQTNVTSFSGNYSIVFVKKFESFSNALAFSSFNLQLFAIDLKAIDSNKPPQFESALMQQTVEVCQLNGTYLNWKYDLPKIMDLDYEDYLVSVTADYNTELFFYNPVRNYILQIAQIQQPRYEQFHFTLTDSKGKQATYTQTVVFVCTQQPQFNNDSIKVTESFLATVMKQKISPAAKIKKITPDGLLIVKFNTTMKPPQTLQDLVDTKFEINGTIFPAVEVFVTPGTYSNASLLNFTWTVENFTARELHLRVLFDNPSMVSAYQDEDKIGIKIYAFFLFQDILGNMMQPEYVILAENQMPRQLAADTEATALKVTFNKMNSRSVTIPRQIPQQLSTTIQSAANAVSSTILAVVTTVSTVSMLLAIALSFLLQALKHLQIATLLLLIAVSLPGNAQVFVAALMNIVTFDLIDCTAFFDRIFKLDEVDPFNNRFDLFGYSSLYAVQNFGSTSLMVVIFPALWILTWFLYVFMRAFNQYKLTFHKKLQNSLFFNGTFVFLDETYILFAVCAALGTFYIRWDTDGNIFSTLMTCLCIFLVIVMPLFFYCFYCYVNNQGILYFKRYFEKRFGELVEPLAIHRSGRLAIAFISISQLRKLALVVTLVYLQQYPIWSIFIVLIQQFCIVAAVGLIEPYRNTVQNQLELLNEAFIAITLYHLILFTDFVVDKSVQDLIGISLIVSLSVNIGVDLGVIIVQCALASIRKLKLEWLKTKQRWSFEERIEKRKQQQVDGDKSKKKKKKTEVKAVFQSQMWFRDKQQVLAELERIQEVSNEQSADQSGSYYTESSGSANEVESRQAATHRANKDQTEPAIFQDNRQKLDQVVEIDLIKADYIKNITALKNGSQFEQTYKQGQDSTSQLNIDADKTFNNLLDRLQVQWKGLSDKPLVTAQQLSASVPQQANTEKDSLQNQRQAELSKLLDKNKFEEYALLNSQPLGVTYESPQFQLILSTRIKNQLAVDIHAGASNTEIPDVSSLFQNGSQFKLDQSLLQVPHGAISGQDEEFIDIKQRLAKLMQQA